MEKIVVDKKKYKYEEYIDKVVAYKSEDGILFDNKEECLNHEEYINFKKCFENKYKLKSVDLNFFKKENGLIKCDLIYVDDLKGSLNDLMRYYNDDNNFKNSIKNMKNNFGWFFIFSYFNDIRFKIINSLEIIEKMENELKIIKEMLKN